MLLDQGNQQALCGQQAPSTLVSKVGCGSRDSEGGYPEVSLYLRGVLNMFLPASAITNEVAVLGPTSWSR